MSAHDPAAEARMDPWCTVELVSGHCVLFGFALRHPTTGGLSWVRSTPVLELDTVAGRALTRSGRRYALGRRIEPNDIPAEGEEAWVAFRLLIGNDARDMGAVPVMAVDHLRDVRWLTARKVARHLGVAPPPQTREAVVRFLARHQSAHLAKRFG